MVSVLFSMMIIASIVIVSPDLHANVLSSYAEAINQAGRQRMLSQRITRLYCQIGLEVDSKKAGVLLDEAVTLFARQLNNLRDFSSASDYQHAIESIDSVWQAYSSLALSAPDKANIEQLVELDEKLLSDSDRVVQLLEKQSGTPVARLVNISGRQRMLSQRLARLYLLKLWGIDDYYVKSETEYVIYEFSSALELLTFNPQNTALINQELGKAKIQWTWFVSTLDLVENESFPLIVIDSSERLLAIMEKITGMYQTRASDY